MNERPIIFSGPMIQALLAGEKTQTRRIVKGRPENNTRVGRIGSQAHVDSPEALAYCPYGQIGDKLWVRETWAHSYIGKGCGFHYRADFSESPSEALTQNHAFGLMQWKPSIHMPRRASRILLEIVCVRTERLQSIGREDAAAEGVCYLSEIGYDKIHKGIKIIQNHNWPEENFARLWDSINSERAPWNNNSWVWVIEFKRIEEGAVAA